MRIKVFINTGFANAKHEDVIEVPNEDWNGMTEKEREDFLDEEAEMFMANLIEAGAYPIDDDEE